MRLLRWIGMGLVGLVGLYLLVRGLVEIVTVDPSRPETYQDDWGGPSYLGVLAVHAGPGLLVVAAVVWWRRRRSPVRPRGQRPGG